MSSIKFDLNDSLLIIKLNRPDKLNSFNREMALEFQSVFSKYSKDDNVRAIMITGEGKAFCAGQDLSEAIAENGITIEKIIKEHYNPIVKLIVECDKPVVAAVNGVAAGAGANLAAACDIILSSESAVFIQSFSKIGLVPDTGGTYFLPRILGQKLALALMLTGDKLSSADAKNSGLVYKVFSDSSFNDEALQFADNLAKMPSKALYLIKRLVKESDHNNLDTQLLSECNNQVVASESYDYLEGVKAFLEKRKPIFKGK